MLQTAMHWHERVNQVEPHNSIKSDSTDDGEFEVLSDLIVKLLFYQRMGREKCGSAIKVTYLSKRCIVDTFILSFFIFLQRDFYFNFKETRVREWLVLFVAF